MKTPEVVLQILASCDHPSILGAKLFPGRAIVPFDDAKLLCSLGLAQPDLEIDPVNGPRSLLSELAALFPAPAPAPSPEPAPAPEPDPVILTPSPDVQPTDNA